MIMVTNEPPNFLEARFLYKFKEKPREWPSLGKNIFLGIDRVFLTKSGSYGEVVIHLSAQIKQSFVYATIGVHPS
jgi:hypothetical protein